MPTPLNLQKHQNKLNLHLETISKLKSLNQVQAREKTEQKAHQKEM